MRYPRIFINFRSKVLAATAAFLMYLVAAAGVSVVHIPEAQAAQCTQQGSSTDFWTCAHKTRSNYYWCGLVYWPRIVRWQVPEGTAPAGGWPTAFHYQGTKPNDLNNSFTSNVLNLENVFGVNLEAKIIHELLDNPANTGRKYAVFAPEPPTTTLILKFWHTNVVVPYSASCDYSFFNDFFSEIKGGSYGAASQYNMNQRYAFGVSSGGYNSSRMAVTFNGSSVWKALGIVAGSYASCAAGVCSVPTLPSNHPPTKFYHGNEDLLVPKFTVDLYYNKLISQGIPTQRVDLPGGHGYHGAELGSTGIKNWFDRY
jgi:hypothetical protein